VYGFRALWSSAVKIRKKTTYILTAAPIVQEMAVVLVATSAGAWVYLYSRANSW